MEKISRRMRLTKNKDKILAARGKPSDHDETSTDAKEEKAYQQYLVSSDAFALIIRTADTCTYILYILLYAQEHVENEREQARLRHILEHKPVGPQPTPPMAGDDAEKREAKTDEANKETRKAYFETLVCAVTSRAC